MTIGFSTRKGFIFGYGDNPFTGKKSNNLLIGCGLFRIIIRFKGLK